MRVEMEGLRKRLAELETALEAKKGELKVTLTLTLTNPNTN